MTLNIGGFDVEIKAKREFNDRFTKKDTIEFLSYLQMVFADARDFAEHTPVENIFFEDFSRDAEKIFDICDESGFYDSIINLE